MTDHGDIDRATGQASPEEEDLLGQEVRALLSSLPRELPPERDLLANIATLTWQQHAISTAVDATALPARPPPWWRSPKLQLAAAAVVLIALTSATTTFVLRRGQDGQQIDAPATIAETSIMESRLVGFERLERDYAAAIQDLTAALVAERDRLPTETVQLIEQNLRIIDAAIEESMAALREAPYSEPLQQAVITSYETKLDFLRRAAAITAAG